MLYKLPIALASLALASGAGIAYRVDDSAPLHKPSYVSWLCTDPAQASAHEMITESVPPSDERWRELNSLSRCNDEGGRIISIENDRVVRIRGRRHVIVHLVAQMSGATYGKHLEGYASLDALTIDPQ